MQTSQPETQRITLLLSLTHSLSLSISLSQRDVDGWKINEVLPLSVIPTWRAVEEHNQEAEERSHTRDATERHTRCVAEREEAEELRGHSVEMGVGEEDSGDER